MGGAGVNFSPHLGQKPLGSDTCSMSHAHTHRGHTGTLGYGRPRIRCSRVLEVDAEPSDARVAFTVDVEEGDNQ